MNESFSVDLSLIQPALSKLESELEDLDSRLKDIYQRATVSDQPIVQSVVHYFNPTPEECKMLSKVWDRLSVLLAKRKELNDQVALLKGMTSQHDWLYEQVGDHSRDVDTWLANLNSEEINESEAK